ncbi:hypothetical protein AWENTII_009857 [Aspergillus wentii]
MVMENDMRSLRAERHNSSFDDSEQLADAAPRRQCEYSEENPTKNDEQGLSSFNRLPPNVIEHILYLVDPNTFASLVLLNRNWRHVSDSLLLYSYHLSRCPSFSMTQEVISDPVGLGGLSSLKRKFFSEISRNTFDVFLRPHKTLIKLISTSMSSSTAFPQGEAFRFTFSARGQMILCLSSSRIIVLDVTSGPAMVKHELKTRRRPLSATILDDGSLLAVVSSRHQVNIYSLSNEEAKHIQGLALNDVPRSLALSPTGGVLAIAYDDMIEVYALGEDALVTQRRAVRCFGVDYLSFSCDGEMLFGSSADGRNSNVVTITVPFYTEPEGESSSRDIEIRMWTTQILFPDIIRGYSHACLLPVHAEDAGGWILGYDRQTAAFKAIRANSVNSGTTYFVPPLASNGPQDSSTIVMPTADSKGELIALGFQSGGLWLYGVPDRLDVAPAMSPTMEADAASTASQRPMEGFFTPQDDFVRLQRAIGQPKVLIRGHQVTDISGITAAHWVHPTNIMFSEEARRSRLVAVAPGGVSPPTIGEEDVPVDGGRVLILDFERSTENGKVHEINIEIGEAEPKMLREPNSSLDTEVELERRRTRVHRGTTTSQRARAATRDSYPAAALNRNKVSPFNTRRNSFTLSSSPNNDLDFGDTLAFPDTPYDNTQPRSRDTLQRAATAAAVTRRRRNPSPQPEANRIPFGQQIPHESDADNWVPPPPPYTREPDVPLPESLRRTLLPTTAPVQTADEETSPVRRAHTTRLDSRSQDTISRSRSRPAIQRLNTITGSRLVSRIRRNTRDSETHDRTQGQTNGLPQRRRGSSVHSPIPVGRASGSLGAQSPEERPTTPGGSFADVAQFPLQSNSILPLSSATEAIQHVPPQAVLLQGNQPARLTADQPMMGGSMQWPPPIPPLPDGASRNYHSYSISSPNLLHVPEREYVVPDRVPTIASRTGPHRPTNEHPQPSDIGRMNPGQRVSTDPTNSQSPTPSNDIWRRRIEEWNERTIYERSRKSRRCVVM